MASSSTAFTLRDSGFHVRNIPNGWNDWNLFQLFNSFGRVGYCRIAARSNDGNQLGFINMLSVSDADKVRENIIDGCLTGEGASLRITDLKTGSHATPSSSAHKLPTSPIANQPPVHLFSTWLPLNKEVEVQVVDYLPSSSVAKDLFALTLIEINNATVSEKYCAMFEKMNNFAQLTPFDKELEIGYDGCFRESSRLVHRVRRISATKVYLLDSGRITAYDKNKCFQLPKVFQALPTRVSLCGLDGLKWSPAAIPTFDKVRLVVKQWGIMEKSTLRAVACGFQGCINMISLFCGKSVLAERLQQKGACEYLPRHAQPRYTYSRETILQHRRPSTDISEEENTFQNTIRELKLDQ